MKFTLIGATGWIGSHILSEAVGRGHEVIAVARSAGTIPPHERVRSLIADVNNPASLAAALPSAGTVVVSLKHVSFDFQKLLRALADAKVHRYIHVGGAGSLKLPDGTDVVDSPTFPAEYLDEARAARAYLKLLLPLQSPDWAVVSPPAEIEEGRRTGHYRTSPDQLIFDATGRSHVAVTDFACAIVDELESPQHHRTRFAVAY